MLSSSLNLSPGWSSALSGLGSAEVFAPAAGSALSGLGSAGATAGAASGAGGLLSSFGGPVGLGLGIGANLIGGMASQNAAQQAEARSFRTAVPANVASQEFMKGRDYGRQLLASADRARLRGMGRYAAEDFQNFLNANMTPLQANRQAFGINPLFAGA